MDELELNTNEAEITRTQERIIKLNTAANEAKEAAAVAQAATKAAEDAKVAVEKERDFYASFSDSVSKYPAAQEFRDKIKEKVLSGYTAEDATVAVLNAEGKLTPTAPIAPPPPGPAAGGSAVNQLPSSGNKTLAEMTRDDKRNALMEAEKRGDIGLS